MHYLVLRLHVQYGSMLDVLSTFQKTTTTVLLYSDRSYYYCSYSSRIPYCTLRCTRLFLKIYGMELRGTQTMVCLIINKY